MDISKKNLLAITLILTASIVMFATISFQPVARAKVSNSGEYCWIEGDNLDIGFSKYGEMIGYNETSGTGLGIQYPGYASAGNTYDQTIDTSVDPFGNEYIGVDWWWNGWFVDIKYTPLGGSDREIWAFALFSDAQQHGGDWITMPEVEWNDSVRPLWQELPPYANPSSYVYPNPKPLSGGRKTNGNCETEDIEIIYDGPRKFVAVCKTRVSDVSAAADLIDITFTFIFNKAEKNIIIIQDIERLYEESPLNIAFGSRGEWILGTSSDSDTYIHWYTGEPVQYWDTDGDGAINGTEVETTFETYKDYLSTNKHPREWWDEVAENERPTTVYNEWTEEMTDFPETWLEAQETFYGREWHTDKTIKEHSYAVAQVISQAGDYVGALAVWPHPEFWSAASTSFLPARTIAPAGNNPSSIPCMFIPISRMLEWHRWTVTEDPNQGEDDDLEDRDDIWVTADDIRMPSGATLEPIIPKPIYEHIFELNSTLTEYRIVLAYMLTDRHDADDADADDVGNEEDWSNGLDVIDWEIQDQSATAQLDSTYSEFLNSFMYACSQLRSDYDSLEANYSNLIGDYHILQGDYDALIRDLYITRNSVYILITTTIILIATTVYFAVRKHETP